MRHIFVVVCGGKMAAHGDSSALGVNGLIQQFTAITGKIVYHFRFGLLARFHLSYRHGPIDKAPPRKQTASLVLVPPLSVLCKWGETASIR